MIPYIHVPDLSLGPLTLHPFGLLVATGVIVGTSLAMRRARQRGIDEQLLNSFITWMLVSGFINAHVLDEIFYHPSEIAKNPLTLIKIWEGLSSFGGFVGGLIGVILWKYFEALPWLKTPFFTIPSFRRRVSPMPILPFADLILSVFPVAWIFGRSGCSVVHDHPGMRATADSWFAVAYGRPSHIEHVLGFIELRYGTAPQFDLGTLELLFTLILAALFALTWSRKMPTGSYAAAISLAYAPVRFAMDFLRIRDVEAADPRYGNLTPAQWSCVALFGFGLVMAWRVRRISFEEDPTDLVSLPEYVPEFLG